MIARERAPTGGLLINGAWRGTKKNPGQLPGRGSLYRLRRGRLLGVDSFNLRAINQLDVRHRSVVARAEAALEDAQVATGTLAVAGAQLDEELAHGLLIAQAREGEAAVSNAIGLRERDERLGDATEFLGLGRVVRISSCLISDAAMFLNMASRWLLVRLSLRPDFWWRMAFTL